ncbi:MAG: SDR family NAD(P)-dependent oxidoreductase [Planctomycetota bacterium]
MSDSFFRLDGQTAIVTGAGQGIGAGIARRLAAAGARVGVFDLDPQQAAAVAQEIQGISLVGDVTREADIERALAQLAQAGLAPDILVNNAGILGPVGPSYELSRADLERVLAINLVGAFSWCRAVLPGMLERGYGRIVNMASIAGKEGNPNLLPYSVSKAGMIAMTKSMAKEVAGKGDVTVNSISPAVIHTPMMDTMPQATRDFMVSRVPMGRPGTIAEVAALVHFLASSESSFTTGQCYDISGGRATY